MCEKPKDIKSIFLEALEKETAKERASYLNQVCGNDTDLRAEFESLLKSHGEAGDFLESPTINPEVALDNAPLVQGPGTEIGNYELIELIGEGGMGLVYLAQQQEPVQRKVALKIVKLGMDTKQVVARFEAERQTLAVLEHPNIAHVFDAGTTETGRPYFVMEHVEGRSITKYCDEQKLSVEQRLELFQQVCEGVHHAHQKGIIHRDLKPSNILVSVHGDRAVPKIIDFGIAKAITQPLLTEKTSFTEHGQLLGTPEYMSPEQAEMAYQDVDTRSDIYSLGVLLYELLAGATPFDAKRLRKGGIDNIQQVICQEEPRTPSARLTSLGDKAEAVAERRRTQIITLTRRLHRELEWIPMKAMRKERTRRYRSASELSDDIQNYLTGAPLLAGPESNVYRARKFVHKHAGFVASAALVAVVIVIGLITSTAFSFSAEKARGEEAVARTEAEQARDKEAALRARAEKAEAIAEERNEEYRRSLYVNSIQLADAKYRKGNIGNARKLLESCPEDLRAWEWDRVNYVLDHSMMSISAHADFVTSVALSPDAKRVVSGGYDRAIKVWDISAGKELISIVDAHSRSIDYVEFSPNGKQFVSCSNAKEIKVWDTADINEPIISISHGSGGIPRASFSPDGSRIVSAMTADRTIKVWDIKTGAEVLTLSRQKGGAKFAAFSPNGKHIVSADWDGTITMWDSVSGDEVKSYAGHDQNIHTVSFDSDGGLFASTSSGYQIKIWDVIRGSVVETFFGHRGWIDAVAFSPDGKYIISGSYDSTVRIWDITTGAEIRNLRGHEGVVTSVQFAPNGKQAVSGSWDGTIKVWEVNGDRKIPRFWGHRDKVSSIAFSPDGKRLVSLSRNVKVWDVISCSEIATFSKGGGINNRCSVSFSPDGKKIASLDKIRAIVIHDAETGHEIMTLGNQEDNVYCLAYSPDGKHIVSGSRHGRLKLWDVNEGEDVLIFSKGGSVISSVAFSPDGQRIASSSYNGKIKVWDVVSGTELMSLIGHGPIVNRVTFSPDGKRIASSCQEDYTAKIWDAQTGKELKTLQGHGDIFTSIAFSPGGRRLVTASRDGTAKIWDSSSGEELLTLYTDSPVADVAFSPDGKSIAGSTWGNTVVLWDSAAPEGGYLPRKIGMAARSMVDELHETHGFYHDVIDQLESDTTLDELMRKAALQIANSRRIEDVQMLANKGWKTVSSAGNDIDAYRSIVNKAQRVARSEPTNTSLLRTLGVGQYRVGAYADALNALTNAEKMRVDAGLESDQNTVALIAMTHYQLGRIDEGRSAIKPFRDSLEEIRFADVLSGKFSHWIEAEKVFAGTNEPLVAIWGLISAQKLDRAVELFTSIEPPRKTMNSDVAFSVQGISRYLSRACYVRAKSRLAGDYPDYVNRASDYEAAIRVDPNYVSALKDLAWLRATCHVEEVRIPTRAMELAAQACELTDWKNHACLSVLAGACSESEQYAEAVKWQQEAIALLSEEDQAEWADNYHERLRLYQSSKPYSAQSRSGRGGGLSGDWRIKMQLPNREVESILAFSRNQEGYTGQMIMPAGAIDLKDVKFEENKLSFWGGQKWKFTGTIEQGELSGLLVGDRREFEIKSKRTPRLSRAVGSWDMKIKVGENEYPGTLTITADKEGNLGGTWKSSRGESKVSDLKYEDRKLTFTRVTERDGNRRERTFEGTIGYTSPSLEGVFKSDRGEASATGTRVGASLIGTWDLDIENEGGTRKQRNQRLKVNSDLSAIYGPTLIKKITLDGDKVSFKYVLTLFNDQEYEVSLEGKIAESKLTGELKDPFGMSKVTGTRRQSRRPGSSRR